MAARLHRERDQLHMSSPKYQFRAFSVVSQRSARGGSSSLRSKVTYPLLDAILKSYRVVVEG